MSISREEHIKILVAKLAYVDGNTSKRVRLGDVAKALGLEEETVEKNRRVTKIETSGESRSELSEENAEKLIERLLWIRPGIVDKFESEVSRCVAGASITTSQTIKPAPDLKSIIENFLIVDGSNVLYWMATNNLDDKVNLIPLLISLSAIKRKGFDFCCFFDAKQIFEIRENKPEQFKELEKLRKRFSKSFSVVQFADDFIVLDAKKTKRKVLSNDKFRDEKTHLPRLPKSQLVDGAVANCQIAIPKLDIIESLHSDLRKAVRELETELEK